MQVGSICRRQVVTVDAQSSLAQAAALMRDAHVGALVVTQTLDSGGEEVCGILTDRDLVTRVMADRNASMQDPLSHWTQEPLAVLLEDDGLDEALQAMKERGVRRLLVKDAADRLAGILSIDDVIARLATQLSCVSEAMQSGLAKEAAAAQQAAPAAASGMSFPCFGTGTWSAVINREEKS